MRNLLVHDKSRLASLLAIGLLALPVRLALAAPAQPVGDLRKVGGVQLKTTCAPAAQKSFDRGLALLHSFFYEEALRVFDQTAALDPACAIAHWGAAMTYYHPIWAPPDEAALKAGAAAIDKAKAIGGKNEIEKQLIAALAVFFSTGPQPAPAPGAQPVGVPACHGDAKKTPDHSARAKAYTQEIEKIAAGKPDDVELTALHALALLGTAPPGDKTLANPKKAAALLAPMLVKYPDHPGVIHYYIHACDSPPMAAQALPAARRYAKIAPSIPHVLHMPSHIFTRLGMWTDSVQSNLASGDAARAYAASHHPDAASFEELHAADYLAFAYLQMGADKKAQALFDHVRAIKRSHPDSDLAVAYAQGAVPARFTLERGKWKDAAALEIPALPYWGKFPFGEAHLHFARGIGGARSGQIAIAKAASVRLGELRKLVQDPKFKIFSSHIEAEQLSVDGYIAHAEARDGDAEKLLQKAADIEDNIGLHPVSPGFILPARELLGDLLLELKRPADAQKQYEASLVLRPARFYATAGAARAASEAGDKAAAAAHQKALVALTKGGDGTRPELASARPAAR